MPDLAYLNREIIRDEALYFFKQDFPDITENDSRFGNYFGAYRHAYGSAVLTREFGALVSDTLGKANEIDFYGLRDNPPAEKNQDLWNNAVGREIGSDNPSGRLIADRIKAAIENGDLILYEKTDQRIYGKDVIPFSIIKSSSSSKRDNTLIIGESATDTFDILKISGQDYIVSVVNDGTIKINGKTVSGSIPPKTDALGNKLENVWTYEGMDFYRVSSADGTIASNGDSLVIVKAGEKTSTSNQNKIIIPNFPFSKDRAFGISLGLTKDLKKNNNGDYTSVIGYDFANVDIKGDAYVSGGTLVKTADNNHFFTCVHEIKLIDGAQYSVAVNVIFNSYGEEVSRENLNDQFYFSNVDRLTVNPSYFYNDNLGKKITVIPYSIIHSNPGKVDFQYTKVGFCVIDENGKRIYSQIVDEGDRSNLYHNAEFIYGGGISEGDSGKFFLVYYTNRRNLPILAQAVDRENFQSLGSPVIYDGNIHGRVISSLLPDASLTFNDGNLIYVKSGRTSFTFAVSKAKYRLLNQNEITTNYNLPSSGTVVLAKQKKEVANIPSDSTADFLIQSNPDSNLVITGREDNKICRVNIPVTDIATCKIYSIDANAVSLEDILAKNYNKKLLRSVIISDQNHRKLRQKASKNVIMDNENTYYFYDGNDDVGEDNFIQNSTHTLIFLPNNQTIIFYDTSSAKIELDSSKYFTTLGNIDAYPTPNPILLDHNPTSHPSRQPSSQPSFEPSGQPSNQPISQPTFVPSSQPNSIPTYLPSVGEIITSEPTLNPSSRPSGVPSSKPVSVPTSKPSKQPISQPTSIPSSQPSSIPTYLPSVGEIITSEPTLNPSSRPSGVPSSKPVSVPTSNPSKQPISQPTSIPSSQPSSIPTYLPSVGEIITSEPTLNPSSRPSGVPSSKPISSPTSEPSNQPNIKPSTSPNRRPTINSEIQDKSNQPSYLPKIDTVRPTAITMNPIFNPTSTPTIQPAQLSISGSDRNFPLSPIYAMVGLVVTGVLAFFVNKWRNSFAKVIPQNTKDQTKKYGDSSEEVVVGHEEDLEQNLAFSDKKVKEKFDVVKLEAASKPQERYL